MSSCRAVVSQVITGYFPILILQMFLSAVPPIMIMLSSLQGYISWSQIQKSACSKVLWFTIWNIFFTNVLSGSALYRLTIFLEPKEFPRVLAEAVPAQVKNWLISCYTIFSKGLSMLRNTFPWNDKVCPFFKAYQHFIFYVVRCFSLCTKCIFLMLWKNHFSFMRSF